MVTSQIRANARESLQGKWGKAALLTLVYGVITFAISFVLNLIPVVGSIILLVIELPISYGLLVSFMKLKRNEEVGYTDFLSLGFSSFGKAWGVFGNMILKMIIPLAILVVSIVIIAIGFSGSIIGTITDSSSAAIGFSGMGIIGLIAYLVSLIYIIVKGLLYSLSYYILNDNENMSGKEIVEESARLMRGNRWRFFWLPITFIGWIILSGFTLGIGMLWVMPYMMVAYVCFYEDLANKTVEAKAEDSTPATEE